MARNYEKQNQKFVDALLAVVRGAGATPGDTLSYDLALETKAGTLRVTVRPNVSSYGASVFARFDDVDRGNKLTGCNPCSGKWNTYFFVGDHKPETIAECVTSLKAALAHVV